MTQLQKCPVTVLTGFLGAGKTSLINSLIRSTPQRRFAVIVNEFGSLGIDADLITSASDDVIQLANGCLCCSVRSDLIEACARLATRREEFDWLLIETSGLADPVPVAQSFLISDGPAEDFRLDGVICLTDALHIRDLLGREEIARRQLAMADRIILTKTDLIAPAKGEALLQELRQRHPHAEVSASRAEAPAHGMLTGLDAWQIGSLPAQIRFAAAPPHDISIGSHSFSFERAFDFTAFSRMIRRVMATAGEDLLRIKGVLWLDGEERRFAFHGVQGIADGDVIGPWGALPRQSNLVVIGRNLDARGLAGELAACLV